MLKTGNRWGLVVAAGLVVFMAQLDATIVNVALPSIEADLGTRTVFSQWVVLGYLIPLIGFGLGAGRWVDVADARRAFRLACAGFAVASVAAGLSGGIGWLVAARVLQGCFAVILLSLVPVLTTRAVAPGARGRAFGIVMVLGPVGGMAGPFVGGQLVQAAGWPWIFYVSVPVAAVAVVLANRQLPLGPRLPMPRGDWLAEALTFGGGAVAVLVGLSLGAASPAWLLLAVAGLPLLVLWTRTPSAAAVGRLLASGGTGGPHAALVLTYTALFVVLFLLPFFLQRTLGAGPGTAGLVLLAFPAAVGLVGLLGGALADRFGAAGVALAGAALTVAGLALLVPAGPAWSPVDLVWRLAVAGAGFGLFNGQVQVITMNRTPSTRLGLTSGTTNLARQLGVAAGSATGAFLWTAPESAMRTGALVATALCVGAALVIPRTSQPESDPSS